MTQQPAGQTSAWTRVLAAAGGLALVGASIVLSTTPAAATGLEAFAGCDELQAHLAAIAASQGMYEGDVATSDGFESVGGQAADGQAAAPTAAATAAAGGRDRAGSDDSAGAGDGTNVQVEGVDELDIVDVLADGRIVAARDGRVVLIDAAGQEVLATLAVPSFPQLTFDEERSTLWAVSSDGLTTTLTRTVVDAASFRDTSTWTVDGYLVDLRRRGDRVHLVALDDAAQPIEGDLGGDPRAATGDDAVPFGGTSPVPCDQVLHSPLPGGPATTLVATFAATGELTPVAATEIVGAGDNVLVTDTALYVSTPSFATDRSLTGIHRFDLDGLHLTGSGSVEGHLLNQFSLDEHDGHLRAAVTVGDGMFVGRPMPVEGRVMEDAVAADVVAPTEEPVTPAAPLNEIVTFDLDGALDIVGRSTRFGHEGETLHGIRFAGPLAYAVTFLQTDPLYVIDLSQPAFPKVLGEIEVPGFSAYLHPISPTQVVGFGPDGEGRIVARLFDIADPTAPRLLDTVSIAADSPVVYDHHALRTYGDSLLIAANEYVTERPDRCGTIDADQAALDALYRQLEEQYRLTEGKSDGTFPPEIQALEEQASRLSECVYPNAFPRATVVTLTPDGSTLGLTAVDTDASDAQRVLPLDGGYLIIGTDITRVDASGSTQARLG